MQFAIKYYFCNKNDQITKSGQYTYFLNDLSYSRLRKEVGRLTTQMEETRDGVTVVRETLKSTNEDLVTIFISNFIIKFTTVGT